MQLEDKRAHPGFDYKTYAVEHPNVRVRTIYYVFSVRAGFARDSRSRSGNRPYRKRAVNEAPIFDFQYKPNCVSPNGMCIHGTANCRSFQYATLSVARDRLHRVHQA